MKKKILFCIYHLRDHDFFLKLVKKINQNKYNICLLYFIKIPKYIAFCDQINFYEYLEPKIINNLKIKNNLIFHEKISTNSKDEIKLKKKFIFYYQAITKIITKFNINIVIQELGGFICHLSIFEASKKNKIKHIFIEPSFITKHCYFLINSIKINEGLFVNTKKKSNKLKKNYLKKLIKDQYIAINNKDMHLKKKNIINLIFSYYTIKVFFKKIKQLILQEKTEFNNLTIHLLDFCIRIKNQFINFFYKFENYSTAKKFIYFPLHVPKDLALTLRAPKCLNQISLLRKILKNSKEKIIFKEHPLIFAKYNYFLIKNFFYNSNFFENHFSTNQILKNCKFIITINSKAGLEALALNYPVMCLSSNYYCGKGLAKYCKNNQEFLKFCKNIKKNIPQKKYVNMLLFKLSRQAGFFDLYNNDAKSIVKCAKTINYVLNKC